MGQKCLKITKNEKKCIKALKYFSKTKELNKKHLKKILKYFFLLNIYIFIFF